MMSRPIAVAIAIVVVVACDSTNSPVPVTDADRRCAIDADCVFVSPCYCVNEVVNRNEAARFATGRPCSSNPSAGACPRWRPICESGLCRVCVEGTSCGADARPESDASDERDAGVEVSSDASDASDSD